MIGHEKIMALSKVEMGMYLSVHEILFIAVIETLRRIILPYIFDDVWLGKSFLLDHPMEYAVGKLGMTHIFYFLGGDPLGFPDTMNLQRDLYRALEGDVDVGRKKFLKKTS